jgi:trigger factor
MLVQLERLTPVLVELTVQVPQKEVRAEVDKAYAQLQRTARVRGYRPGKAPREVLTHLYSGRIHADVAQRLMSSTLDRAVATQAVQPLTQPETLPTSLEPTADFSYKARFEVRPEVAEVKWEGLSAKRPSVEVTEAAIDAELQALRREHSTLAVQERAATSGDVVSLVFTLHVDGSPFGTTDQELDVELGSGQVFKEIEAAVVGASAGDQKTAEVTFSAEHQQAALRGKTGSFALTVKEVKERSYPALDDEFAKDCEADSLDALKERLRGKIEGELKQKATDAVAEQLVLEICRANPLPLPPSLVAQQAKATEEELNQQARRRNQRLQMNPELRAQVRADAEMKVRAGLVMAEIARIKEVKVTDADIEKGYEDLAQQTGKNVPRIKAEYRDPKKRELLIGMILEDKILDLIEAAATIEQA